VHDKFEDIFEKKVYVIVVFSCSILFAKTHEIRNRRFYWVYRKKIEWKRRCL